MAYDKQTFFDKTRAKAFAFSCICNFACFFLNYKLRDGHHLSKVHKKYRLSAKITVLLLIFRSANIRAVNGLGMIQQKPLSHPTPYDGQLLLLLETFHNKQLCSQGDSCRGVVFWHNPKSTRIDRPYVRQSENQEQGSDFCWLSVFFVYFTEMVSIS